MEILIRLLLIVAKLVFLLLRLLLNLLHKWRGDGQVNNRILPGIANRLLTLSVHELRKKLRDRQLTSVELVNVYIERIKEVNPHLNAIIQDRFEAALIEATHADKLIAAAGNVKELFVKQPLLGLPFTVKESCALAGMSFAVGSLSRSKLKAKNDGVVVARLRAAGAIPLLVSATPEYCYSADTDTPLNGRCLNPYDSNYTPGGSSGGEGALNGAGASLFGIGSDLAGSIRIPSLYCGIYGHKCTGGVVTNAGHFPNSIDADMEKYFVLGPMTRFAGDLAQLLEIMAGEKAAQLRLREPVQLSQLKVHYALGYDGLNGLMHQAVSKDIQMSICKAVEHLKSLGLSVTRAQLPGFRNSIEMALGGIARLRQMNFALEGTATGTFLQLLLSLFGRSNNSTNCLIFDLMRRLNSFMPAKQLEHYNQESLNLARELIQMLGDNGVLIFPTLHATACRHGWTPLQLWGVDYSLLFNILGLPATHVPMGKNAQGLPVGFSVIAAPHQDRLCISVAMEMERAFGGWQSPTPNQF